MVDVNKRIRALLKERNWSETRLAKESGLNQSTISNLFARGSVPSVQTLEIICEAFHISLSEFFEEKQTEKTEEELKIDRLLLLYHSISEAQQNLALELLENLNKVPKTFE